MSAPQDAREETQPIEVCIPFEMTLRIAREGSLGLMLSWDPDREEEGFRVESITPGEAVEAWNKQCVDIHSSRGAGWAVYPGDTMMSINGMSSIEGMLSQISNCFLLKLVFYRRAPVAAGFLLNPPTNTQDATGSVHETQAMKWLSPTRKVYNI